MRWVAAAGRPAARPAACARPRPWPASTAGRPDAAPRHDRHARELRRAVLAGPAEPLVAGGEHHVGDRVSRRGRETQDLELATARTARDRCRTQSFQSRCLVAQRQHPFRCSLDLDWRGRHVHRRRQVVRPITAEAAAGGDGEQHRAEVAHAAYTRSRRAGVPGYTLSPPPGEPASLGASRSIGVASSV